MKKFVDSIFVETMCFVSYESYNRYWDERNGGNISVMIDQEEVDQFDDICTIDESTRQIELGFDGSFLADKYFLVTGTGSYFRRIKTRPEVDLGLVKIAEDGKSYYIVWGFADGGRPTSEFPSHLMSHIERLKVNPDHRAVMHCHPTNFVALSFTQPLDEKVITRLLWKMQAESIVVFPEGIGIIPYMTPGTTEIGQKTSEKMSEFQAVMWPHHGIFASGNSLDEAYGLIEVIEKAAMIYTAISSQGGEIKQEITDKELSEIAEYFKVKPHEGFLN